jgi:SAM-dependent methyltransferase
MPTSPDGVSLALGYSKEDLQCTPQGANLGLGCGNPQALAMLKPGETVLDLGSGAGFDCFLAARAVGPQGRVIGIDMTPEMVHKARENAAQTDLPHVEFRLGEIEHLPVADNRVDVIMSNCVINLAPDKRQVWREAFRVLKPGGRLAIADIIALQPLPSVIRDNLALVSGCVGGAAEIETQEKMLRDAGFDGVTIEPDPRSREVLEDWFPDHDLADYIASATITARKPPSAGSATIQGDQDDR